MFRIILGLWLVVLVGCESAQERNISVIRDRGEKLKYLASWKPTWCRVETHLTQPALSRYQEMFPKEVLRPEPWAYTWKAFRHSCEVSSLDGPSDVTKNHKGFLDSAMCTLLQTHWVNSPFSELNFTENDVLKNGENVQIRIAPDAPELGLFLDPTVFVVTTKTKSRVFKAEYEEQNHEWRLKSVTQTSGKTTLQIDNIEYNDARLNGRPILRSFWISVGEDRALQHTHVELSECRNF